MLGGILLKCHEWLEYYRKEIVKPRFSSFAIHSNRLFYKHFKNSHAFWYGVSHVKAAIPQTRVIMSFPLLTADSPTACSGSNNPQVLAMDVSELVLVIAFLSPVSPQPAPSSLPPLTWPSSSNSSSTATPAIPPIFSIPPRPNVSSPLPPPMPPLPSRVTTLHQIVSTVSTKGALTLHAASFRNARQLW